MARWSEMGTGKTEPEVFAILGAPLIMHGGRGYMQWTYDAGGAVMFRQGLVIYWDTPAGYQPAAPLPVVAATKPALVAPTKPARVPAPAPETEAGPNPALLALARLNPDSYAEHREREAGPEQFVSVRIHR